MKNKSGYKSRYEKWYVNHPEKVIALNHINNREISHKGGKYYEKHKLSHKEGLTGEKERVRQIHSRFYRPYKSMVDPEGLTQIHHQWLPGTAEYTGIALVEKDQHMHGYVDVIQILEGEITLLTEEEVRGI